MADKTGPVSAAQAREAAAAIQWHPGFCSAIEFELRQNKDALRFDREFELSHGPMFLDLLVIKKPKDVQTDNEIGRIFRMYNICEFKSPGDSLSIDDYFKTISYAGLVKNTGNRVNQIPAKEITLTFIRAGYPREMVRELVGSGAVLTKPYPGIYYLNRGPDGRGDVLFPAQIIVTGELDKSRHSSLRILCKAADEEDVRLFLTQALSESEKGNRENVDAILQVSVSANMELYERIRREDKMCQALRELMKDEIAQEVAAGELRGKRLGERLGELRGERNGTIMGTVAVYRDEMGLDPQAIIERISEKFDLSKEQAAAYVTP